MKDSYRFYRNTVFFVCIPNVLFFIGALITTPNTVLSDVFKYTWMITTLIYFVLFVIQPEKAFEIKDGKIKYKP
jgi:hypothetical protein